MTETFAQIEAGAVPERPFLLAGQMTTTDPTRSPAGTESMWAYTHAPQQVRSDAGDGGIRGTWDDDDLQRLADRVQGRVEDLAPGFGSRIINRRVLGPRQLEARNANLVGGAINGGTAQLHQQLVFRPIPGAGRGGDAGARALPRLGVGAPRRWGARRTRQQRGAGGDRAPPATPGLRRRIVAGHDDSRVDSMSGGAGSATTRAMPARPR